MKVRFLRLSSFVVLVQLAVSIHAIRMCSLVEKQSQATFLPDPDNCRKFVVCVHGLAVARYCPNGLHWNSMASTCDYPARAKCKILNSVVEHTIKVVAEKPVQSLTNAEINTLCSREAYLAYPKDCTKFLKCSNGRIWIFDCPKGLQWNVARNLCDYPTSGMEQKIMTTSLVGLISTLGTTQNEVTEIELPADTTNESHVTESRAFGTSSLPRETSSEQSGTSIKIVEETTNVNVEQQKLFNIDANDPLSTDFENLILTDDISKINQLLQWTSTFLVDKTTQQPEKTVAIEKTEIKRTNSEEKTIMSDLKDSIMEHYYTIQPEIHITARQETTSFSKDQTPNTDRPITTITPEILTTKSTHTTMSFEQTTLISKEFPTLQNDATSAAEIKRHDSILKLLEEPINKAPVKIEVNENATKTRIFKAIADDSLLLFGSTTNRTLSLTLSKTSKDAHNSPSNTTAGVREDLNSTNFQDKTILDKSSTDPAITTTTFDPRLPFKAVECEGINNEERFSTTDCRKYYQCRNGFAYLLNCFEGYAFSTEQKICILSDICLA